MDGGEEAGMGCLPCTHILQGLGMTAQYTHHVELETDAQSQRWLPILYTDWYFIIIVVYGHFPFLACVCLSSYVCIQCLYCTHRLHCMWVCVPVTAPPWRGGVLPGCVCPGLSSLLPCSCMSQMSRGPETTGSAESFEE